MKKIIPILVCAVLFISVKSECDNNQTCVAKFVNDLLNETSVIENVDIKLDVPYFEQIENVGIEDLKQILFHLTSWFESRLNKTSFLFKHVNNKTKIFVKSFDFNVDTEIGNAKINVDLTEETDDSKKQETINKNKEIKTTTATIITTTESTKQKQINKTEQINRIIEKHGGEEENKIFRLEELDTTYYDENEDNSTDYPIIDYVEMYKDTTNEENVYTPTELPNGVTDISTVFPETEGNSADINPQPTNDPDPTCHGDLACKEFTKTVFPWVASIFVTNNKENQFSYFCDGALLTEKIIVTGARCMFVSNKTWNPDNVLVFLGKVNLQSFGGDEKVHKIKSIVIHPNFTMETDGKVLKDLALIELEDAVEFKENIQSACLHQDNSLGEAATTAWGLDGALMPIFFNKQRGEHCFDKDEDVFCATYGNEIALCPSYGGVFASRQTDRWCLAGIFYGDPIDRGICFAKDVHYTSLRNHLKWIDDTIAMYKNGI